MLAFAITTPRGWPEAAVAVPAAALTLALEGVRVPGAEQLASAGQELLTVAASRLGRPSRQEQRVGRVEREVVAACAGAALLGCARDGEATRLGPRSLGPQTRFVVDHAPCAVLLIWPGAVPRLTSIPPPPR